MKKVTIDDIRQIIIEMALINSTLESIRLAESTGITTLQGLHDLIANVDEQMAEFASTLAEYIENIDEKLGNDFTNEVLEKRAAKVLNAHYKEYEEKLGAAFGALLQMQKYKKTVKDPKVEEIINDSVVKANNALSTLRKAFKAAKEKTGEESIARIKNFRGEPLTAEFFSKDTWFNGAFIAALTKAYPIANRKFG